MIIYFEVHSFTDEMFKGNPAGVCALDHWIDDQKMQQIAKENGLSETAFFVKKDDVIELRWFTPVMEVDLCGHATLASAYVLFEHLAPEWNQVVFSTRSGDLIVEKSGAAIVMDFPTRPAQPVDPPDLLEKGLRCALGEVLKARDYMVVFDSEEEVKELDPDFGILGEIDCTGIIVTAPGNDVDFVSRFFAPRAGIDEDPVTGSAHCTLTPYWADKLGKPELAARQISQRGGELACRLHGDRVQIAGKAALYLKGFINID